MKYGSLAGSVDFGDSHTFYSIILHSPLLPRYSNLEYEVFQGLHILYLGCCEADCPLGDVPVGSCHLRTSDIDSQTLKLKSEIIGNNISRLTLIT